MIGLVLASAGTVTGVAAPISLECAAINFAGEVQQIKAEFNPNDLSSVDLQYSVVGNTPVEAELLTISDFGLERPKVVEFFATDEKGELAIRFLEQESKWAVELAPANWRPVVGPIVTGRCKVVRPKESPLRPLDPQEEIVVDRSLFGPVNTSEGWVWGKATFACKVSGDDFSISDSSLSISEDKSVVYSDSSGALLSGKFDSGIVMTLSGVTYLHRKMNLTDDSESFEVSVNYRHGRLWLNGLYSKIGRPNPNWVLGVCNKELD